MWFYRPHHVVFRCIPLRRSLFFSNHGVLVVPVVAVSTSDVFVFIVIVRSVTSVDRWRNV